MSEIEKDHFKQLDFVDDGESKKSNSRTVNTTEEAHSLYTIPYVDEIPKEHFWDREEERSADAKGAGLSHGGTGCGIRSASEGPNSYIKWLKRHEGAEHYNEDHSGTKEKHYHHSKDRSLEAKEHHHRYGGPSREGEKYHHKGYSFLAADKKDDEKAHVNKNVEILIKNCQYAYLAGQEVERYIAFQGFQDPNFAHWKNMLIQGWLPNIPDPYKKDFATLEMNSFLKHSYILVDYALAGLEQMHSEQYHHPGGYFTKQYDELIRNLRSVLSSLDVLMDFLEINIPDFKPAVFKEEYRVTKTPLGRDLRDYLIVGYYVKAMHYISKGFSYIRYEI